MKNSHKYILAGGGILLLLMVVWEGRFFWSVAPAESSIKTYTQVTREDLSVSLIERGLLRPAKVEQIKSHISSNQAQLVWCIDEGEEVSKDQIIARFDTKPFMDRMERAEQQLADAVATLDSAGKNLAAKKVEGRGRIEAAERQLDIARIKADDVLNGSGRLQRRQLESKLEQTVRVLNVAEQEQTDMEVLLNKGHVSRREYEQSVNAALSARDSRDLVQEELANFDQYEWPRMTREAQLVIEAAEKDLSQTKRIAELELQRAHGEIVKLKRDQSRAEKRLDAAMADVAACDVRASIDGTLLYKELPRPEGRRKVQIGDNIWQGQTFMEIPDTSGMIVEIEVREIDVAKLSKGLNAQIELDALPGKNFNGEVESINSLALEQENQPGVRTFNTIIRLNEITPGMHAGMSANVRIQYLQIKNTLVIPLQALSYDESGSSVLAAKDDGEISVPVIVGALSEEKVQILGGLRDGDKICLNGCGNESSK